MSETKTDADPLVEIMEVRVVRPNDTIGNRTPPGQRAMVAAYQQRCIDEKKYICHDCNKVFRDSTDMNTHFNSRVHNNKPKKERTQYYCALCDFHTFIKTQYTVHCGRKKHIAALAEIEAKPAE